MADCWSSGPRPSSWSPDRESEHSSTLLTRAGGEWQLLEAGQCLRHCHQLSPHAAADSTGRGHALNVTSLSVELQDRSTAALDGAFLGGSVRPDSTIWVGEEGQRR